MTWPIGGVGRRNSVGSPSNTNGRRPVRGCQAHPIPTWPDSAGREALTVDGPLEFERLVACLQGRGLHAQFRRRAEGDTVFVGAGPGRLPGVEFVGFRRAIYIGRREGGAYYAFDFVETDDEYSEDEVVEYVVRRLTAPDEEFHAESRRRGSRDRYRRGTS